MEPLAGAGGAALKGKQARRSAASSFQMAQVRQKSLRTATFAANLAATTRESAVLFCSAGR
jgi:hypothetical protein